MSNQIKTACFVLGLLVVASSTADAQRRAFAPVTRVNRVLGVWNGPGYHTCNPGPDSSYYNPWNERNSYLISKSPEFLARFGHELNPTPMDLLRSGHQAFAQPPNSSYHSIYSSPAKLDADFVPNKRDDEEDDSSFESDEQDNDFMNDDIDDRFDEDADDLEKATDPFGEQADAFEDTGADSFDPGSLKQNVEPKGSSSKSSATPGSSTRGTSSEGTSIQDPGGIFLPASHRSFEW